MKKHYKILIIAIVALAMLMAFVGCEVTHEYEVYFVSDGEHYQNMEVITGSNFALPTDPQKDGYTFGGWWTANGISNDNWGDLFTANYVTETTITVFAKWTANSYTVVYDGNGATAGGMADQIMVYDQQADLSANAFVKDGYIFTGWSSPQGVITDGQTVSNLATEGSVTLTAQWEEAILPTATLSANSKTYTGNNVAPTVEVQGLTEGTHYEVVWNAEPIVVGTYTAIIKGINDYRLNPTQTLEFSVTKADYDLSGIVFEDTTYEYDGTEHTINYTGTLPQGIDGISVTAILTNNVLTDAGNVLATISFATESANYYVPTAITATLTVAPKVVAVTWSEVLAENLIYNGTNKESLVSATYINPAEAVIDLQVRADKTFIDAGDYTFTASFVNGETNYALDVASKIYTIAKADYDMSGVSWDYQDAFTYNKAEQSVALVGLNSALTAIYENASKTYAGSYTATATFTYDTVNYNEPTVASCDWVINKAKQTISIKNNIADYVYSGSEQAVTAIATVADTEQTLVYSNNTFTTVTEGNGKVVTITAEESANYVESTATYAITVVKANPAFATPSFVATYGDTVADLSSQVSSGFSINQATDLSVGTVASPASITLTYTPADLANYNVVENISANLIVNRAQSVITAEGKTVDGNGDEFSITGATLNHNESSIVYSDNNAQTEVGTYDIIISVAESANYTSASVTVKLVIRELIITNIQAPTANANSFIYNGAEQTYVPVGFDADTMSIESNSFTDVGTYEVVVSLKDVARTAWQDDSVEAIKFVFDIAKASLTITATDKSIAYGQDVSNSGVSYSGFVAEEGVGNLNGELAYTYNYAQFEDIGDYQIAIGGFSSNNYDIIYKTGLLQVVANKSISLLWSADKDMEYDGTAKDVSLRIIGLLNGDSCDTTIELATGTSNINAGTFYYEVTSLSNSNYMLQPNVATTSATYTIAQRPITVTGSAVADKDYDGTDVADITQGTVDGIIAGDDVEVNVQGKFASKYVQSGASVVELVYSLVGADIANYVIPATEQLEATISKATLVVEAGEAVTKVYDGTTFVENMELGTNYILNGLIAGDNVSVSFSKAFNKADCDASTVKMKDFALVGDTALTNCYNLTTRTLSVQGIIEQAENIISDLDIASWVYGETKGTPSGTSTVGAIEFGYSLVSEEVYVQDLPENAGAYVMRAFVAESLNYKEALQTVLFEVAKADYDISSLVFESASYVYDTTEKVTELSGTLPVGLDGIALAVAYSNNVATDASENNAQATFSTESINYNVPSAMQATLTITQAINEFVSELSIKDWIYKAYDAIKNAPSAESTFGTVEFTYNTEGNVLPQNAGEYSITAKVEGNNNYTGLESTMAFNVAKATFDMSSTKWNYTEAFTYDKTEKSIELQNLPEGVAVESYSNNASTSAGSYMATADLTYDKANYNIIDLGTFIWTINKAIIAVPTTEAGSKVYTGEKQVSDMQDTAEYTVIENNGGISAGSYGVVVQLVDFANYKWSSTSKAEYSVAFEISKAKVQIDSLDVADWKYGDDASEVMKQVESNFGAEAVVYTYSNRQNGTYSSTPPQDAGTYYIKATIQSTNNYMGASFVMEMAIGKADYDTSALGWSYSTAFTYDKIQKAVEVVGLPNGVNVISYSNNTFTNAGTYSASAVLVYDTANYNEISVGGCEWTINRAIITVPEITFGGSKDYTGDNITSDITETEDYKIIANDGGINVGVYDVVLSLYNLDNYEWSDSVEEMQRTIEFSITQATSTITGLGITGWTYNFDGNEPNDPTATPNFGEVVYSYTTATGEALGYVPYNAGDYYVVADIVETANWSACTTEFKFSIAKDSFDMSLAKWNYISAFTYNTAEQRVEVVGLPERVSAVTYNYVFTNAGTYTATADLVYDTANYNEISLSACEWVINKAQVVAPTITDVGSAVYTGSTLTSSLAESELFDITQNDGGINVGDYDVIVSLVDNANYMWQEGEDTVTRTISFVITQATSIIKDLVLPSFSYAAPEAPQSSANFGSDTVTYSYSTAEDGEYTDIKPENVGTYFVKATIAGTANYAGSVQITSFEISQATNSLTTDLSITSWTYSEYDAESNAPIGVSKFGQVVFSYSTADGLLPTDAGAYQVIATVAETANYSALEVRFDFDINRKGILADWFTTVTEAQYTGAEIMPTIDTLLSIDTEYEVSYTNNTNLSDPNDNGDAEVTVDGIGNYEGSVTMSFNIFTMFTVQINDGKTASTQSVRSYTTATAVTPTQIVDQNDFNNWYVDGETAEFSFDRLIVENISILAKRTWVSVIYYGQGTNADPYRIYYNWQMNDLATKVNAGNNFERVVFALQNNINIANADWKPIGNNNYAEYYATGVEATSRRFAGTFDGKGFTLSNYKMVQTAHKDTYDGLFGYIATTGVVQNLKVESYAIDGKSTRDTGTKGGAHSGAIAGINSGKISNVAVGVGTVTSTATLDTGNGGIAGGMFEVNAIIMDSISSATVNGTAGRCTAHGGITGSVSNGTLLNCTFTSTGSVKGTNNRTAHYNDGVLGYVFHGGISGCSNALIIRCRNESASISGSTIMNGSIVGYMHNGSDANTSSASSDTVLNVDKDRVGSLNYYSAIIDCSSTGTSLKNIGYWQNDTGDGKKGIVVSSGTTATKQITGTWTSVTISKTYYDNFLSGQISNGTLSFGNGLEIPEEYFVKDDAITEPTLTPEFDDSHDTLYDPDQVIVSTGLTVTESAMIILLIVGEFCGVAGLIVLVVAIIRNNVKKKKAELEAQELAESSLAVASGVSEDIPSAHTAMVEESDTNSTGEGYDR